MDEQKKMDTSEMDALMDDFDHSEAENTDAGETASEDIGIVVPEGTDELELAVSDDSLVGENGEVNYSALDDLAMEMKPAETEFTEETVSQMQGEAEKKIEAREEYENSVAAEASNAADPDAIVLDEHGVDLLDSRRRSNRMYRGSYVHSIGNHAEFKTTTEEFREIRNKYIAAARSYYNGRGIVLEGVVTMVEDRQLVLKDGGAKVTCPCCVVVDGPVSVYIPIQYMTRMNLEGVDPKTNRVLLRNYANARIGSKVRFMVQKFSEGDQECLGSRLPVLDYDRRVNYLTPDSRGRYVLNEGDIVEARITFVGANRLGVEVFGVDSMIPLRDISYVRQIDLYEFLEKKYGTSDMIGKTIPVKITELTRKPFNVAFSLKEANADTRAIWVNKLKRGQTVKGVIVAVNRYGIFAHISNTEMDCICNVSERSPRLPNVGDVVSLFIYEVNKEDLKVSAFIHKIF